MSDSALEIDKTFILGKSYIMVLEIFERTNDIIFRGVTSGLASGLGSSVGWYTVRNSVFGILILRGGSGRTEFG